MKPNRCWRATAGLAAGLLVASGSGLPVSIVTLRRCITDANRGMEPANAIPAQDGRAEFVLPAASYTTLWFR